MLSPSRAPQQGQACPSGWSRSKSFWRQPSWSIRSMIGKSMRSAPRGQETANPMTRRTDPNVAEKCQPPNRLHEPKLDLAGQVREVEPLPDKNQSADDV